MYLYSYKIVYVSIRIWIHVIILFWSITISITSNLKYSYKYYNIYNKIHIWISLQKSNITNISINILIFVHEKMRFY